ncbi:hypothetical protein GCM10023116_03640 [Kistimonas scapharcae]|uniref:Uncharacterized protein n=1 Tax=Kistimonas scapharcae TaxID=1036133 RepID=A0ABP8UYC3_9GAMM
MKTLYDIRRKTATDLTRRHPGCTSAEIAEAETMDPALVCRMLNTALCSGQVRSGLPRDCSVRESLAITWWPVLAEMETTS